MWKFIVVFNLVMQCFMAVRYPSLMSFIWVPLAVCCCWIVFRAKHK